jgi:hypothetical protein
MRVFVNAYPREPIVRRLARDSVVHAPPLLRADARPRERRPSTRRSAASRGSPDSDLPPPPVEVWRGLVAASVRMQTRLARRRAKWAAA